ncbi:dynein light chain Tctex-type 5-like [Tubulanus polymorphus]|uniref:dynein light chain Tctex-type 5-like n=1 Tax=Tubulanus polymorphus TaxID=672921 RepID=UPI003DA58129
MSRIMRSKDVGSVSTRSGPQPSDSGAASLRRSRRPINAVAAAQDAQNAAPSSVDASLQQAGVGYELNSVIDGATTTTTKRTGAQTRYENTYKTEPDERFRAKDVEKLIKDVLGERLADVYYEANRCKSLTQELAAEIMERLKSLAYKRYKMVAVVSIGSLRERPGMQFGSRCLWNEQLDSFLSVKYSNGSLFAVAMIYGLYFE